MTTKVVSLSPTHGEVLSDCCFMLYHGGQFYWWRNRVPENHRPATSHLQTLSHNVVNYQTIQAIQVKLSSLILRMDQMSTASYSRKWFIRDQGSTVVEKIHTWCKEQSLTLLYISLTHPVKLQILEKVCVFVLIGWLSQYITEWVIVV
jgi:hypothetical protein